MTQYLVVIEQSTQGFGAYVPDLPGCVTAGASQDEVLQLIREAIEMHIEAMLKDGEAVPAPASRAALVDIGVA
jgi:predicted RNase H-like HicB family nuclease